MGTQNSQQTCLSLSLNKIKSQSKTSIISKVSTNSKNESADVKMLDSSLCKKNADNLAKVIKQIKKLKLQENMEKQATSEKSSEFGRSTSSSKTKNYSENSSGSPTELKKQTETVNSEAEIPEISNFKTKKLISKFDKKILEPKMLSHKHWELIESVLNRASLKERGLWSDLRHFIKKKIGRDINDEGAQEVCIEIEQEVPKTESGEKK